MNVVGQDFFTPIIQPINREIFESRAHKLLNDFTKQGGFKVFLEWMRNFMRKHLNWSY